MNKEITHILVKVNVYDEWFDEGADCALVPIDCLQTALAYLEEMKAMTEKGLDPAKVAEFNYSIIWLTRMPVVTDEFAKKIVVIDPNGFIDYEDCEEPYNSVEDVYDDFGGEVRADCAMLNTWKTSFSITANIKHTDIQMGGHIYYETLEDAPTLYEVMKKVTA